MVSRSPAGLWHGALDLPDRDICLFLAGIPGARVRIGDDGESRAAVRSIGLRLPFVIGGRDRILPVYTLAAVFRAGVGGETRRTFVLRRLRFTRGSVWGCNVREP